MQCLGYRVYNEFDDHNTLLGPNYSRSRSRHGDLVSVHLHAPCRSTWREKMRLQALNCMYICLHVLVVRLPLAS